MIFFKLVVSVIIIILSGYIGMYKSKGLKTREYILKDMVTFLSLVENEIKYMMSILPNVYESSRQKLVTDLKFSIGQIVVDMLSKTSIIEIEQSIVFNISKLNELTDYDKNVIVSILKNLGRSDLEGQINIIQNGIKVLENQIIEASEIKNKNSKS